MKRKNHQEDESALLSPKGKKNSKRREFCHMNAFSDDNKLSLNETAKGTSFDWNSIISRSVPSQAANVIQHNAICVEAPAGCTISFRTNVTIGHFGVNSFRHNIILILKHHVFDCMEAVPHYLTLVGHGDEAPYIWLHGSGATFLDSRRARRCGTVYLITWKQCYISWLSSGTEMKRRVFDYMEAVLHFLTLVRHGDEPPYIWLHGSRATFLDSRQARRWSAVYLITWKRCYISWLSSGTEMKHRVFDSRQARRWSAVYLITWKRCYISWLSSGTKMKHRVFDSRQARRWSAVYLITWKRCFQQEHLSSCINTIKAETPQGKSGRNGAFTVS